MSRRQQRPGERLEKQKQGDLAEGKQLGTYEAEGSFLVTQNQRLHPAQGPGPALHPTTRLDRAEGDVWHPGSEEVAESLRFGDLQPQVQIQPRPAGARDKGLHLAEFLFSPP